MPASSMKITEDEIHPGLPAFVWRVFTVCAVLAALSLAVYAFGALYGDQMAKVGQSTDPTRLEVVIANDVYAIPANMIRHEDQRTGGAAKRIDISVHWPTRSGYSNELAKDFASSNPDTIELVFASFSQRNSLLDMTERFSPVYRNAIEADKIQTLANGLYIAPLSAEFGYINERLIYSRMTNAGQPKFVARCQATAQKDTRLLLPCETDIFVGETSQMKVRFALSQLQRWELFSAELRTFAKTLLVVN